MAGSWVGLLAWFNLWYNDEWLIHRKFDITGLADFLCSSEIVASFWLPWDDDESMSWRGFNHTVIIHLKRNDTVILVVLILCVASLWKLWKDMRHLMACRHLGSRNSSMPCIEDLSAVHTNCRCGEQKETTGAWTKDVYWSTDDLARKIT